MSTLLSNLLTQLQQIMFTIKVFAPFSWFGNLRLTFWLIIIEAMNLLLTVHIPFLMQSLQDTFCHKCFTFVGYPWIPPMVSEYTGTSKSFIWYTSVCISAKFVVDTACT